MKWDEKLLRFCIVLEEAIKSVMNGMRCGGCIHFILDFKSGSHTAQVLNHVIIVTLAQLVPLCRGTRHVMRGQSHARLCHSFLAVVRISADRKIADTRYVWSLGTRWKVMMNFSLVVCAHRISCFKSACRSQELFYSKYNGCVLPNVTLNLSCCTLRFVRINYHRHMVSFTLTALEGRT